MTNHTYPNLEYEKQLEALDNRQSSVTDRQEKQLYQLRIDEINKRKNDLQILYNHYNKIKKRWNTANNVIKYSGLTVAGAAAITACVLSSGLVLTLYPTIIVGGIVTSATGIDLVLTKILTNSFTGKRRRNYAKKASIVKNYQNKIFIYTEKIRNDGIITVQELEGFRLLFTEMENELNINTNNDKNFLEIKKEIMNSLNRELRDSGANYQ